jgi:hypothetical protein
MFPEVGLLFGGQRPRYRYRAVILTGHSTASTEANLAQASQCWWSALSTMLQSAYAVLSHETGFCIDEQVEPETRLTGRKHRVADRIMVSVIPTHLSLQPF